MLIESLAYRWLGLYDIFDCVWCPITLPSTISFIYPNVKWEPESFWSVFTMSRAATCLLNDFCPFPLSFISLVPLYPWGYNLLNVNIGLPSLFLSYLTPLLERQFSFFTILYSYFYTFSPSWLRFFPFPIPSAILVKTNDEWKTGICPFFWFCALKLPQNSIQRKRNQLKW